MSRWIYDPRSGSCLIGEGSVRRFGYVPDFENWLPGDLLLFSTSRPTFSQRKIVETQLKLNYANADARWHHAAVYIGDRYLCEARSGGVRFESRN